MHTPVMVRRRGCFPLAERAARSNLLQLDVHLIGRFRLPVSFRSGLCLPLDPRGMLAARLELCPLCIDPARGLVRAGLQLIQPGGAPVVSGDRSGSLGFRRSRLGWRRLGL